jgi:hypothetical protein
MMGGLLSLIVLCAFLAMLVFVTLLLLGIAAASAAITTARSRCQARAPIPPLKQKTQGVSSRFFWRWQAVLTYLVMLWVVERLLIRAGENPHTHPLPFVLFGLGLGLALTLLEREWDTARRCGRTKNQGNTA